MSKIKTTRAAKAYVKRGEHISNAFCSFWIYEGACGDWYAEGARTQPFSDAFLILREGDTLSVAQQGPANAAIQEFIDAVKATRELDSPEDTRWDIESAKETLRERLFDGAVRELAA